MNFFIDTNLIVYAFDKKDEAKQTICEKLIRKTFSGKNEFFISNQVLGELFSVLTTKVVNPLDKKSTKVIISALIDSQDWRKINYTCKTVKKAIKISEEYNLPYWDCLIAATMLENNIFTIYTENEKDFKKIPGIKVINPLRNN